MILNGQRFRNGMNVRAHLPGRPAGGPRFAYHALFGAAQGVRGRTSGFSGKAAGGRERGVPVYLPPIPDLPGVDMKIEVAGVPATATLSAGRALPSGAWLLARDEAHGLRLLPILGCRLPGPVTLCVTVSATDRATGRVASLSASIEVAAPWDGGPSAGGAAVRYSLADDAGGRFEIDPVSGLVTVADESLLDHAADRVHAIAVRTTAADGASTIRRFEIALLDGAGEFSISDIAAEERRARNRPGAVVGAVAVDAGAGERISFRLLDDAEGRFLIDPSTGVVSLSGGAVMDATRRYVIAVEAASEGSISIQRFAIARSGEGGFAVSAAPDGDAPERFEQPRLLADSRPRRHDPALWELPAEFAA